MHRPKFSGKIDPSNVCRFIDLLKNIGIPFNPLSNDLRPHKAEKIPDESDRIFYATAKGSDSILISGNLKHYPGEPFIMLPADFLKRLES